MKIGTKSVLYGFHSFYIHPWFVAWGWHRLFGFPLDPRLWIAFFVHDLGYIGKPNMDGPEGESHVEFGAKVMGIFGREWHDLALLHSRFYAANLNQPVSRLCLADKMAICLTPYWLWKLQVIASGEWSEYVTVAKYKNTPGFTDKENIDKKYAAMVSYLKDWIREQLASQ